MADEYDKSHKLIDSLLETLDKNEFYLITKAHFYKGRTYRYSNKEKEAIESFQQALFYKDKVDDYDLLYNIYNELGISYYRISLFDKSIEYFVLSYDLAVKIEDEQSMAIALANIATLSDVKGQDKKAIEYYFEAIKVFEEMGDKSGIAKIYNNLGIIFRQNNEYEKALEYYNKALTIKKSLDDSINISETYINIGVVYEKTNELEKSINFLNKALDIYNLNNDLYGKAKTLNNLGSVYQKKYKNEEALSVYTEALQIRISISDMRGVASTYYNMGNLYMDDGNFNQAVKYFNQAFSINDSLQLFEELKDISLALYDLYEKENKTDKALEYYISYSNFKDSVVNIEKIKTINEFEIKYQTDKQQQELSILKKENEVQKSKILQIYFIVIIILILIIALGIVFGLLNRQQKLLTKNKTIILEKKVLRTQMNPHFIFNTLLAIQSFIFENDAMQASLYLSDFAKLVRLILANSRQEFIPLNKEIETLDYYFKLQKLRFENKFDYQIEIDKNIDSYTIQIPPMLAQPIIENSIEHGIRTLKKKGMLKISFLKKNKDILFKVEDNGIGFNGNENKNYLKQKSYSLDIIRERLKIFFPKRKKTINIANLTNSDNKVIGTSVSFFNTL